MKNALNIISSEIQIKLATQAHCALARLCGRNAEFLLTYHAGGVTQWIEEQWTPHNYRPPLAFELTF